MTTPNPAHIVLQNVRISYEHLLSPHSQNGQEAKYSAMILLPKSDMLGKQKIDTAIRAAAQKAIEKFGQAFPANPRNSVHDGDGTKPSDNQPYGDECKGHWVFTASNKNKPNLVDINLQPILDPTEVYSGMYANVGLTFFGYNAPQNKGIGVALDNVQKIADGEPLGGVRASAEDDFAGLGAAPAPSYGAQNYGVPPQPYYGADPSSLL